MIIFKIIIVPVVIIMTFRSFTNGVNHNHSLHASQLLRIYATFLSLKRQMVLELFSCLGCLSTSCTISNKCLNIKKGIVELREK